MTLTLAWDVDDVLNDLTRVWLEEGWRRENPQCSVSYEALERNPPHSVLGVSLDAYLCSLDRFRQERQGDLVPSPDVLSWFQTHGEAFRHLALTAVPGFIAPVSARWVLHWFGRWIRTFAFVPSHRVGDDLPHYDKSKIDYLENVTRADVLIDDNADTYAMARQAGIRAVLFPRPWNRALRPTQPSVAEILSSLNREGIS